VEALLLERAGADLRGGQQRQGQAGGGARRAAEAAGRAGAGAGEGAGVRRQAGPAAGRERGGGDGEAGAGQHAGAPVVRARLLQYHRRRAARGHHPHFCPAGRGNRVFTNMKIEEVQSTTKKQRVASHTHIKGLGLKVIIWGFFFLSWFGCWLCLLGFI
jgi:hypothetical protein